MRYAHIVGWGKYLPSKVMTNDDIAKFVDTSDAWIRERTGIGERRIAADNESTSVLATYAAQAALDVAGVSASQIDLIMVATATPENFFPATACAVQDALGAIKAGAFDVSAACSGFVYALSMGADAIKAGSANYVLVIGAETLSRIVDWTDRNTCVLFGDGAGAVVLQASDQPGGVLSSILRSDGSGGDFLYVSANGNGPQTGGPKSAIVNSQSPIVESHFLKMNGREVYKFATRVVDKTLREVMHKVGWVAAQVDIVIPHQANIRILESAMKSLGVPMEKTIVNLDRYGNTSAASIPIALAEAAETGRLRPHDKILTIGFGGGLTWAAAAIEWGVPKPVTKSQRTISRFNNSLSGFRSRARKLVRNTEQRVKGKLSAIGDQQSALSNPRKPEKDAANEAPPKS
jgi:3-oxoacyl-[acyl-carrier-protein] synthase III